MLVARALSGFNGFPVSSLFDVWMEKNEMGKKGGFS
jgi:hypothetical protein